MFVQLKVRGKFTHHTSLLLVKPPSISISMMLCHLFQAIVDKSTQPERGKNGETPFCPQSDPVVSLLFTDQPRHCGLLSHPVQLVHAGESAAGHQRPQPAARRPARPAERPLLPGEPETHRNKNSHFLHGRI